MADRKKPRLQFVFQVMGPLNAITTKTGLLMDWLHTSRSNRSPSSSRFLAFRWMICIGIVLLLLAETGFKTYQLLISIRTLASSSLVLYFVNWINAYLLPVLTQIFVLMRRRKFLEFFGHLSSFGANMSSSRDLRLLRKIKIIYSYYFIGFTVVFIAVTYITIDSKYSETFLTTYQVLQRPIVEELVLALHTLSISFTFILLITSDLLPCLTYYCIAHMIVVLKIRCASLYPIYGSGGHSRRLDCILKMWKDFETLKKFTDKANHLFGPFLLIHNGLNFFFTCGLTYGAISWGFTNPKAMGVFLSNSLVLISRTVCTVMLFSQLPKAKDTLSQYLSRAISNNYFKMTDKEREMMIHFNFEVKKSSLYVSPLSLYEMRPATLLAMLSLNTTYLVVLLQSSEPLVLPQENFAVKNVGV